MSSASTHDGVIITDALVIGAGPVGLFQVFELGLLDIRAQVVDALPHAGGQPSLLYPDKPIYDVPGLPVCTGQGLSDALLKQCAPFSPGLHLGQTVTKLERQSDGLWMLETSKQTRFLTKTVFIAAGVGAFEPKRLKVEGLQRFEGKQVFFRADDAPPLTGQRVLILGDDELAIDCALHLAEATSNSPATVTLMHRRDSFRADETRIERLRVHRGKGSVRFIAGQVDGIETESGTLKAVSFAASDGNRLTLPVDTVLSLQGLSPRLGPLADWGLEMERKQLVVDTEKFETSERGIFAVGDINTYPGKRKLLVCGFHECTLAAYAAASQVFPDRTIQLQYTTTSPHLHALLGVTRPV